MATQIIFFTLFFLTSLLVDYQLEKAGLKRKFKVIVMILLAILFMALNFFFIKSKMNNSQPLIAFDYLEEWKVNLFYSGLLTALVLLISLFLGSENISKKTLSFLKGNWKFIVEFISISGIAIGIWLQIESIKISNKLGAWEIISNKAIGNSGKIKSLEYLAKEGEILNGIDFSVKNMSDKQSPTYREYGYGAYLSGLNLSAKNIGRCVILENANFSGANLEKAIFEGVNLIAVNFSNTNLKDANFSSNTRNCIREKIRISTTSNDKVHGISRSIYDDQDDLKANLLYLSDFTGANLKGALFAGTDLGGANFTDANLSGAEFGGPHLRKMSFAGSYFVDEYTMARDKNDEDNRMINKDDKKSISELPKYLTKRANLREANFTNAKLYFIYFNGFDLTKVKFNNATIYGSTFLGANLTMTDFKGVKDMGEYLFEDTYFLQELYSTKEDPKKYYPKFPSGWQVTHEPKPIEDKHFLKWKLIIKKLNPAS